MSKSSIYESNWINLVFENRNKEYGAFQLRRESTKTSIMALLVSISICALLFAIPKVLHSFQVIEIPMIEEALPQIDEQITLVNLTPPIEKPNLEIKTVTTEIKPQLIIEKTEIKNLAHPSIVQASLATPDAPKTDVIIIPSIDPNAIIGDKLTIYTGASSPTNTDKRANNGTDFGNTIVTTATLDKLPGFPGGIEKFYDYVGRNFETSEINEEKMVRIMVYFVVEKDGSMSDIQVKNNPGYGLAQEALRVLKSLKTKWTPGQIDSQPVRTAYSMPISVQMN
ncbi:energy transducer TonB [Flavobacterium sp. 7A]|uniref:energy transducer TonB n=1 Tax=Flavobacterium sp. 7A TaxID=2940571 RepID=UPI002226AB14|nr:energy transducer TonB [Flavobacterium sp. 7A]MCW2120193.1 protein TonB [Flavobacterium sp. 7A]